MILIADPKTAHQDLVEAAYAFGRRHGAHVAIGDSAVLLTCTGRILCDGKEAGTFVLQRVEDAVSADFFGPYGSNQYGNCGCTFHTRLDAEDVLDRAYRIAKRLPVDD